MGIEKFVRGYDWVARADLAFGWIFDWRRWLSTVLLSSAGGVVTFIWASFDNWSPLGVWIAAITVAAAIAVFFYFALIIIDRFRRKRRPETTAPQVRDVHAKIVKNVLRDVGIGEAFAYLGTRDWGNTFFEVANSKEINGAKLYDDFLQAAADGLVPVWGKTTGHGVYEPIPRTFWYENRIEWFSLLRESARTESSKRAFTVDGYQALMTSRVAVENLAPGQVEDEGYPNVRAADNPSIHDEILKGADRQKFLALLSSGRIKAWARPMYGSSDYVKIPDDLWDTHKIDVQLHSGDSVGQDGVHRIHHQSYLRRKTGTKEATHYDVAFNRAQLKGMWPNLSFKLDDGSGQ